jgi:hypothetical protein
MNFDADRQILIGRSGGDHISIYITDCADEERWLDGNLAIKVGPWSGALRARFHEGELHQFATAIEKLYGDLVGPAELHPLEPYMELRLCGNGKGEIVVEGKAQDCHSNGTFLVFRFGIDQTELLAIVKTLKAADPM